MVRHHHRKSSSSSSSSSPWNSSSVILFSSAAILLFFIGEISALMCYEDHNGVKMSEDDDSTIEVSRFKKTNCSHNGTGNIEKVRERRR
jgi:hypothetical protein